MAQKQKEEIEAQKEQKARKMISKDFWTQLLKTMNEKGSLFQSISPATSPSLGVGVGIAGLVYNFVINQSNTRVELYIDRGTKEDNEFCFDFLIARKEKIEQDFGDTLTWQRLDDKRACRIKYETIDSVFKEENWEGLIRFLSDAMLRLEKAFRGALEELRGR